MEGPHPNSRSFRCVLVLAPGSVGTAAGAEFDLALVEVLLELGPLRVGRGLVLIGRMLGAVAFEVRLVVADDVVVEDYWRRVGWWSRARAA
jgi:hypothetical protein